MDARRIKKTKKILQSNKKGQSPTTWIKKVQDWEHSEESFQTIIITVNDNEIVQNNVGVRQANKG